jgi:hypothetical protein
MGRQVFTDPSRELFSRTHGQRFGNREVKITRFWFTDTGDIHVPVPVNRGTICNLRNPRYSGVTKPIYDQRMVTFSVEVCHRLLQILTTVCADYLSE